MSNSGRPQVFDKTHTFNIIPYGPHAHASVSQPMVQCDDMLISTLRVCVNQANATPKALVLQLTFEGAAQSATTVCRIHPKLVNLAKSAIVWKDIPRQEAETCRVGERVPVNVPKKAADNPDTAMRVCILKDEGGRMIVRQQGAYPLAV